MKNKNIKNALVVTVCLSLLISYVAFINSTDDVEAEENIETEFVVKDMDIADEIVEENDIILEDTLEENEEAEIIIETKENKSKNEKTETIKQVENTEKVKNTNNTETVTETPSVPAQTSNGMVSIGTYKLTAYCNCSICCGQWAGGNTASGTVPTQGRTVACNSLALGTRICINGHDYIVEDTGGMANNVIDIYFNSHQDALNFGVQYAEVFIYN